ncbi:MAG: uracil-DNA glycosylase family protein [Muribaculaceae bacterium]|nr:uracil-DNA glycosylase family protein [Bacteroides sp.]MDE6680848.1 uracil-DNA glycosylase family protein [Muribaculaceae bacterium]MDE6804409.1 uracil-DNA glycosylase family protein [Muribaculaceae bacterium]MDE6842118.1 uracil-DNA glycosylase family protein [Muribaculaceae bacterium]MDE7188527.1 uracil-DNA glycosylase family protein [Muribaculaceae bacterium]
MEENKQLLETHPWPPFIPPHAKVLIMGTFPPGAHRWSMNFYYPNRTNDFWKVMGLLFTGDVRGLYAPDGKNFDLVRIRELMTREGIALNDTAYQVRRLKGNASDKYLEIVTPVDLDGLLAQMPECHTVATTGEKAAGVIAQLTNTPLPRMGEMVESADGLHIWRMPSTSRAYPLPVERKAAYYASLLDSVGIKVRTDVL